MLESLTSLVSLRIRLFVDLPLDHFVRHLGQNLNVVINEQRECVRRCVLETLHHHQIPLDVCTGILLVQSEVVGSKRMIHTP